MPNYRDLSQPTPSLSLCKHEPAPTKAHPTKAPRPYLRRTTWANRDQIFCSAGHLPDYETSIVAKAEAARARRESTFFERLRRAYRAFIHLPHARMQARVQAHSLRRTLNRA